MLMEDPITGVAVFAALIAVVVVGRFALALFRRAKPARKSPRDPALVPVLSALKDLDDEELQAVGRALKRLPADDQRVADAVQPLAAALLDWRSTFDEAARREFLDLARTLVAGYDRPHRPA